MPIELDELDAEILMLLQDNARRTATDIAEAVSVSDNTVHNRMTRLEEAGVIKGYAAEIDPRQAGLQYYYLFTCTARISDRSQVAEQISSFPEVIEITELMTGQENLHVKIVGNSDEDITRMAEQLDELRLEVNDEHLIRAELTNRLDLRNR